jgi:transcription termination factor NusB
MIITPEQLAELMAIIEENTETIEEEISACMEAWSE